MSTGLNSNREQNINNVITIYDWHDDDDFEPSPRVQIQNVILNLFADVLIKIQSVAAAKSTLMNG